MRLSLSRKLGLATLGMAALFAALSFGYLLPEVERTMESHGRTLALKTTASLASALAELVVTRQDVALQRALEDIVTHIQPAYVAVRNADGELLAISGPLGPALRQHQALLGSTSGSEVLQLQDKDILSVSAWMRDGSVGTLHVGYNLSAARSGFRSVSVRFGIIILLSVLAFALMGYLLGRRLVAPLRRLTEAARRIAERGDLREQVQVDSEDEVGQLGRAFSSMVGRLKEVLHQLQSASVLLADAVRMLNESAEAQSHVAIRHAAALQQTQVTTQEIHQTSLMASRVAESVLQATERADGLRQAGETAITESVEGLMQLRVEVQQIATQISALSNRTQQIGGITQTVKDLADQSNMLALNAAIEAVRSGEHGKGFGVVAREIRALADQSIQSTGQVRALLTDISQAIATTVRIIEQGTQRMEAGIQQSRKSGDTLGALSTLVSDNSASVRQIAQTVNQQAKGIEQLFASVGELSTLMNDSLNRLTATQDKLLTLERLSRHVTEVVKSYHV